MTNTVKEWINSVCQFGSSEFDEQIRTYAVKKIVKEFDGTVLPFPQRQPTYRYVFNWVLLEDGTAVGWNESPKIGYSFPRASKKITAFILERYKDKIDEAQKA